jgi:hypothetical protein
VLRAEFLWDEPDVPIWKHGMSLSYACLWTVSKLVRAEV